MDEDGRIGATGPLQTPAAGGAGEARAGLSSEDIKKKNAALLAETVARHRARSVAAIAAKSPAEVAAAEHRVEAEHARREARQRGGPAKPPERRRQLAETPVEGTGHRHPVSEPIEDGYKIHEADIGPLDLTLDEKATWVKFMRTLQTREKAQDVPTEDNLKRLYRAVWREFREQKSGFAKATQMVLADAAGFSVRTVNRGMKFFRERGIIDRIHTMIRREEDNRLIRGPNIYRPVDEDVSAPAVVNLTIAERRVRRIKRMASAMGLTMRGLWLNRKPAVPGRIRYEKRPAPA